MRAQIAKDVSVQQDLQRERDKTLDEVAALKTGGSWSWRPRLFDGRVDPWQVSLHRDGCDAAIYAVIVLVTGKFCPV